MENKKNILVVTAETKLNLAYYNNDSFFIIGVERGCLDLIQKGIKIDLAISDFDQVLPEELILIQTNTAKFIQLNPEKDSLDGLAALAYAREIYPSVPIKFVTNPSRRYDMNLSILDIMNQYDNVEIFNEVSFIKKIPSGINQIDFNNFQEMTYISFFTLRDNNNLILENLKYSYKGELNLFSTRCISNEFIPYKNPSITNSEPLIVIMTK